METPVIEVPSGLILNLRIQPGSSRSQFCGLMQGRLKVRLSARAVEGKANQALIEFLSNCFDIPKSCVSITGGLHSRSKKVLLKGDPALLLNRLSAFTEGLGI